MVWHEMRMLEVHLSPEDYENMSHWVAELILMFLTVQREYEQKQIKNGRD